MYAYIKSKSNESHLGSCHCSFFAGWWWCWCTVHSGQFELYAFNAANDARKRTHKKKNGLDKNWYAYTLRLQETHESASAGEKKQQQQIFLLHLNKKWIKNDGLQKHYVHIMKQNNWYRMMGISNAFSLSVTAHWSHQIYFGRLFQSGLVFMWRNRKSFISFMFFFAFFIKKGYTAWNSTAVHAIKNFTGKSDWQGFVVNVHKVATRSEEHNMFLGQIRLTHTPK